MSNRENTVAINILNQLTQTQENIVKLRQWNIRGWTCGENFLQCYVSFSADAGFVTIEYDRKKDVYHVAEGVFKNLVPRVIQSYTNISSEQLFACIERIMES